VRSVLRVLLMFVPLPLFHALFDQQVSHSLRTYLLNYLHGGGWFTSVSNRAASVVYYCLSPITLPHADQFLALSHSQMSHQWIQLKLSAKICQQHKHVAILYCDCEIFGVFFRTAIVSWFLVLPCRYDSWCVTHVSCWSGSSALMWCPSCEHSTQLSELI